MVPKGIQFDRFIPWQKVPIKLIKKINFLKGVRDSTMFVSLIASSASNKSNKVHGGEQKYTKRVNKQMMPGKYVNYQFLSNSIQNVLSKRENRFGKELCNLLSRRHL